jgi:dsRNA-specific ribonuclease
VKDIQTELDKPGVNSFGLGDFKAPKVLGDILESIAGALFLDTGLDTNKVWEVSLVFFFEPLLSPFLSSSSCNFVDLPTRLQVASWCHKVHCCVVEFRFMITFVFYVSWATGV